jgi:O-acetyl-ADP-ribose deacetylase (regulator of RNase III)
MINYVIGDATNPLGDGNKFIVHICNNIGAWGAGFVMALSAKWSAPEDYFKWWANWGDGANYKLGEVQLVRVEDDIWVANMVAQNGVRSQDNSVPLDYQALEKCLKTVTDQAVVEDASIHMPRIGCGLAGGSWDEVEALINKTMDSLSVTVYDLEQ